MFQEIRRSTSCWRTLPSKNEKKIDKIPWKIRLSLFQFGESQSLRLVRILRSTVMVRVGGGWTALDEFLVRHDPCRGKNSFRSVFSFSRTASTFLRSELSRRNFSNDFVQFSFFSNFSNWKQKTSFQDVLFIFRKRRVQVNFSFSARPLSSCWFCLVSFLFCVFVFTLTIRFLLFPIFLIRIFFVFSAKGRTNYELHPENYALRDGVAQTMTLFKPRLVTVHRPTCLFHQQQLASASSTARSSPATTPLRVTNEKQRRFIHI